ncbi:unnamed protein product [Didymodactylos carnosus]|uniref:EF-hand domain-containing protein n=2 Tax=Didymodactylos carnosus TaxID=1234261 RepID=A0A815I002_9BILA|nr:unnamed protein product [Didymodactylos carnosus]CAF4236306.1 unnamed protein product [Didymodactylos carnosus]
MSPADMVGNLMDLAQKLIDSTLEKVLPPPKDSVTVFQHFDKSHSEPCLVPQCAPDQNLSAVRQKLEVVFLESDANGDGFMTLQEFEFFLSKLNIKMSHQDLIAFLKADKEGKCEVGGITQFINKRWEKFDNLKRDGKTGKLVMVGGVEAKNVLPGEYSLVDLITWSDIEPQIKPKYAKASNVRWTSSAYPKSTSGSLLFPKDFDPHLPIEIGTNDKLAYYGCCLANESQMKVSLLHRCGLQDFTYNDNYYSDYVKGREGLEMHEFAHLDCPFQEDSGFFILGKFSDNRNKELHLTAFKIPTRHTLYVPPLTIHSNDYLKGTWRTMLSDATQINHVLLELARYDGETDKFSFDFTN